MCSNYKHQLLTYVLTLLALNIMVVLLCFSVKPTSTLAHLRTFNPNNRITRSIEGYFAASLQCWTKITGLSTIWDQLPPSFPLRINVECVNMLGNDGRFDQTQFTCTINDNIDLWEEGGNRVLQGHFFILHKVQIYFVHDCRNNWSSFSLKSSRSALFRIPI